MQAEIDIIEDEIFQNYPAVLEILLRDQTTKKNIFWATNNYLNLGEAYNYFAQITRESISGENTHIIMPRVKKNINIQQSRVREMAEVFTPSWICNIQNNIIDNIWFEKENVFNTELVLENGKNTWLVNSNKINFPKEKTWKDYVLDKRLEITCGEAPYITSRYDTTSGEFIQLERRIGLLDRKLRIINENIEDSEQWIEAAYLVYKSIYAFEWQGDSLLLARESMLITFIENYTFKFGKEPLLNTIQNIANIISWNVWQMDGLKFVVPNSCLDRIQEIPDLFDEPKKIITQCLGCLKNNIKKHNGIYCKIMDWNKYEEIKFINIL